MKKSIIMVILFSLIMSSCAHDPVWVMGLETTNSQGYWRSVKQKGRKAEVIVDMRIYRSGTPDWVIMQVSTLRRNGYSDFRYSVGPLIRGNYYPERWFRSYQKALDYYYGIDSYKRER